MGSFTFAPRRRSYSTIWQIILAVVTFVRTKIFRIAMIDTNTITIDMISTATPIVNMINTDTIVIDMEKC